MMERVGKTYTLKNGYKIAKCRCYDGFEMQYFFTVFTPDESDYRGNIGSWERAYELASHPNFQGWLFYLDCLDI